MGNVIWTGTDVVVVDFGASRPMTDDPEDDTIDTAGIIDTIVDTTGTHRMTIEHATNDVQKKALQVVEGYRQSGEVWTADELLDFMRTV